jgi:tetraacyldisaccharide 4'-kinase
MQIVLLPLSWIYGTAVAARNAAFAAGLLRQTGVGVPVIAVGNMTAGGTGKTPIVEYLVGHLLRRGRRPAVISRGYRRRSRGLLVVSRGSGPLVSAREGGDEPVQIARNMPGVSVIVAERRIDAARFAVKECSANVIVMDDGFQHRYLRRNANIVVLDARHDIRREPMLPAGRRREWLSGLRRATLVLFSRCGPEGLPTWSAHIASRFLGKMAGCRFRITGFRRIPEGSATDCSGPAFAFSGIGDHEAFLRSLLERGVTIAGDRRFPDHHRFTVRELSDVVARASRTGAAAIITTEKDRSRIEADPAFVALFRKGPPLVAATLGVEMIAGAEVLDALIDDCLGGGGSSW